MKKNTLIPIATGLLTLTLSACNFIYGLLQKEGAEEKQLLGETASFVYNEKVEEVQDLLQLYGYNPGKVDGKLGPRTRAAISHFQKDQDLKESSFLDKKTWKRLMFIKETGLISGGKVNIRVVQAVLKMAGFNPGKIDGKLGKRTKAALVEFQREHGLKPDGVIGYQTLEKLIKYLLGRE